MENGEWEMMQDEIKLEEVDSRQASADASFRSSCVYG